MLSRDDLLTLYQRLGLSDEARSVIDHVRSSDPARWVRSGRGVSGRYPSKKMGVTIQFESHRVELAAIYEMENDAHVLELCAGGIYVGATASMAGWQRNWPAPTTHKWHFKVSSRKTIDSAETAAVLDCPRTHITECEGSCFGFQVDLSVDVGCVQRHVAQPGAYRVDVDAGA